MKNKEFHGFRVVDKDPSLSIGRFPDKKRVSLYFNFEKKGIVQPLAYFLSEKAAKETLNWLDNIIELCLNAGGGK